MIVYKKFQPTGYDCKGLGLKDRQDWFVVPVFQNRDSKCLERSNFEVVQEDLDFYSELSAEEEAAGHESNFEVHNFGHYTCGWFEIMIVRPGSQAAKKAEEWEACLSDYNIASEEHYSELEEEEAQETWKNCYSNEERLEYIREHRNQFEFDSWLDMLSNVRGESFRGYASELIK